MERKRIFGFSRIMKVAILHFLHPALGSNPAGQSLTFTLLNLT